MTLLAFLLGLAFLVAGGEALVRGASRLAAGFGVPPLVIGLTVVAFGTSAPEFAVAIGSAWSGQVDMAVGSVVGSNIFNVLFILGASALVVPLIVDRRIVRQEVPVMIAASLLVLVLALDGTIGRIDAAMLFALVCGYTSVLIVQARRAVRRDAPGEGADPGDPRVHGGGRWPIQVAWIVGGLVLLVAGSRLLVDAAVEFARALGVSELVIGLTIVAGGTSMPEVAASITATLRGQRDIAVGNVVGSNIFNLLGVLGLCGLVAPGDLPVPPAALRFDMLVMLAAAFACLPVFFIGGGIARWEGAVLLGYFVAYLTYLVLNAKDHGALPAFSGIMLSFVIPITLITFAVLLLGATRHPRR